VSCAGIGPQAAPRAAELGTPCAAFAREEPRGEVCGVGEDELAGQLGRLGANGRNPVGRRDLTAQHEVGERVEEAHAPLPDELRALGDAGARLQLVEADAVPDERRGRERVRDDEVEVRHVVIRVLPMDVEPSDLVGDRRDRRDTCRVVLRLLALVDPRELQLDRIVVQGTSCAADLAVVLVAGEEHHVLSAGRAYGLEESLASSRELGPGLRARVRVEQDLETRHDEAQIRRHRELLREPTPLFLTQRVGGGPRGVPMGPRIEQDHLQSLAPSLEEVRVVHTFAVGWDELLEPQKRRKIARLSSFNA
jgi:hypothetical protein